MDQEKEVAVTAHVEAPAATETAPSTSGSASVDSASAGPYRSVLRTISDLLSLHNVSAYPEIIRVAELADLNVRRTHRSTCGAPALILRIARGR
jgi:hypothetical protein